MSGEVRDDRVTAHACREASNNGRKRNGSARDGGRELLIDRLPPRFEARTLSTVVIDAGTEQT